MCALKVEKRLAGVGRRGARAVEDSKVWLMGVEGER
jgi:hypothetical protein